VSSNSEVRQCWTIVCQMISVEMTRTAVGRTTIECCVRWCATRCAGSDTAGMTSAESWTSARPTYSWCAEQQAASAPSDWSSELTSDRRGAQNTIRPKRALCLLWHGTWFRANVWRRSGTYSSVTECHSSTLPPHCYCTKQLETHHLLVDNFLLRY